MIRADTDQLRAVARQMRSTVDQINSGTDSMRQSMDALDTTWSGSARDRGIARWAEITPKYPPAAANLMHLANELEALAQRLDDAAAVFGGGSGSSDSVEGKNDSESPTWDANPKAENAPKNMAGLFDRLDVMNEKKNEIEIYQVGQNEYAVLLQGTDPFDLTGINSAKEAVKNGFGNDTRYKQALEQMLVSLPPGANVHLVGYSLGGIVAQNVAADQNFLSQHGIKVQTVTTFGSPKPLVKNLEVNYSQEYDAAGDPVSILRPPIQSNDNNQVIVNPESTLALGAFVMAPVQTAVAGAVGASQVHLEAYHDGSSSSTRQAMVNNRNLPFSTDKWVPYGEPFQDHGMTIENVAETGTAAVAKTVSATTKAAVETYNAATHTASDVAVKAGNVASNVVESTADKVGDGIDTIKDLGSSSVRGLKNIVSW